MEIHIVVGTALGLLGLVLGSFAGATVWRLRARQLRRDKKAREKAAAVYTQEVARLRDSPVHKDRSVCLHCGHVLAWYDLVPLVSWLQLGGKCRYCRWPIGWFEPLMELGLAAFFVASYHYWQTPLDSPIAITQFVIWLIAGVGLAILFAYDAKWFLLPDVVTFPLIGLGAVSALIAIVTSQSPLLALLGVVVSCLVLSGLYFAIYVLSRQRWVGFGDVKLGLALGLLLADWRLAILALFLANLIGTIFILPLMSVGKIHRQAHVPFGPLLIAGWAISGLFGVQILGWYMTIALGV